MNVEDPKHLEQYVASGGTNCPFCGSDGEIIDGSSWNSDAGIVWQAVTCVCGRTWHDIYDLAGIGDPESGEIVRPPQYVVVSTDCGKLTVDRPYTDMGRALTAAYDLARSLNLTDQHIDDPDYNREWAGVARGYVMHWWDDTNRDVYVTQLKTETEPEPGEDTAPTPAEAQT